jgi:hypothetical protein
LENLKGKDRLRHVRHTWENNIKMNLTEMGWDGMGWDGGGPDSCGSQYGTSEHGNEPSDSIAGGEFIDLLSNY